jgi:hypothetical protein
MTSKLPTFDWRRTRAAAFVCVCLAVLARSADAAGAPTNAVDLCALQNAGVSATAPMGWTLAASGAGTNVRLRSADGAMGAEWGLAAVAVPAHGESNEQGADDAARMMLTRSLRAMGDSGAPADSGAPRAYAGYFTGRPFETPTHRGVVFTHQYQWDENQSVVSYYIAWADKDRWSSAGFVAANVAFSIHAPVPQSPLNPFWADGKLAEAEAGLRQTSDAYNQEAHVVRVASKTPTRVCTLSLEGVLKTLSPRL